MKGTTIWYNYDLSNERDYVRCIKHIQKIVRGSMSYDAWQRRSKIGTDECPVCGDSKDFVKMESHHYPQTLFDVVDNHMQMQIDFDKLDEITDFEFAQEIMNQHFEGTVNFIVLCEYCHKKFHDNVPEILDKVAEIFESRRIQKEQQKKALERVNSVERNTD